MKQILLFVLLFAAVTTSAQIKVPEGIRPSDTVDNPGSLKVAGRMSVGNLVFLNAPAFRTGTADTVIAFDPVTNQFYRVKLGAAGAVIDTTTAGVALATMHRLDSVKAAIRAQIAALQTGNTFIRNQNTTQTPADFAISGTGRAAAYRITQPISDPINTGFYKLDEFGINNGSSETRFSSNDPIYLNVQSTDALIVRGSHLQAGVPIKLSVGSSDPIVPEVGALSYNTTSDRVRVYTNAGVYRSVAWVGDTTGGGGIAGVQEVQPVSGQTTVGGSTAYPTIGIASAYTAAIQSNRKLDKDSLRAEMAIAQSLESARQKDSVVTGAIISNAPDSGFVYKVNGDGPAIMLGSEPGVGFPTLMYKFDGEVECPICPKFSWNGITSNNYYLRSSAVSNLGGVRFITGNNTLWYDVKFRQRFGAPANEVAYLDEVTAASTTDRARANHTGTQAISTVTGLADSLTAHRLVIASKLSGSGTGGYLAQWSRSSPGITGSELYQDESGNIGIGTDIPMFTLDVNGTIGAANLSGTNTGNQTISIVGQTLTLSDGGGTVLIRDTLGYGLATWNMLRDSAAAIRADVPAGGGSSTVVTGLAGEISVDNSNPATPIVRIDPGFTSGLMTALNLRMEYTDTASMLSPLWAAVNARLRYADTALMLAPLWTGIGLRMRYADSAAMLSPYARTAALSIANWNMAYSWGDHSAAGYQTASTSSLTNYYTKTAADARYLQNFTETDPTVSAAAKAITIGDVASWNAKQNALSGTGFVKISGSTISYDNSTYLTSASSLNASNLSSGSVAAAQLAAGTPSNGYVVKIVSGVPTWSADATGGGGGGGTPGGSTGSVQYNDGTGFSGATGVAVQTEGFLNVASQTSGASITTPTSGSTVYGIKTGTAEGLAMYAASRSRPVPFQSSLAYKEWGSMTSGSSSSTGLVAAGGMLGTAQNLWAAVGTADAQTQYSAGMSSTFPANRPRTRRKTGTTTNTVAGFAQNYGTLIRGTTTYGAGFQYTNRFALGAVGSGMRVAAATNFVYLVGTNPSAATDFIGICKDAADANLQLMYNDGSGTATKVDLGVTPSTSVIYGYAVWCKSGDTKYSVQVWTESTTADRTILYDGDLTTNVPGANVLQAPQCQISNGTGTTDCYLDFISAHAEMD